MPCFSFSIWYLLTMFWSKQTTKQGFPSFNCLYFVSTGFRSSHSRVVLKNFASLIFRNYQNLRKILGRISVQEFSISKVLDFQYAILLKNRLLHRFFSRICQLLRQTLWRYTSEWLNLLFSQSNSNTEITMKKIPVLLVNNFLPKHILDSLQNTTKDDYYLNIFNDTFS